MRKEFNSHRIFLVHQYGRRDVMSCEKREEDLLINLSIVYFQISNTYLPESVVNIFLYEEANPVSMCP